MISTYIEAIFFGLVAYSILLVVSTVHNWRSWNSATDTSLEGVNQPIRLTKDEEIIIDNCGIIKNKWVISEGTINKLSNEIIHSCIQRSQMVKTRLFDYTKKFVLIIPAPLSILTQPYYSLNMAEFLLFLLLYYLVIAPVIIRQMVYHLDRSAVNRDIDLAPILRTMSKHSRSPNIIQRAYMPSYEKRLSMIKDNN